MTSQSRGDDVLPAHVFDQFLEVVLSLVLPVELSRLFRVQLHFLGVSYLEPRGLDLP